MRLVVFALFFLTLDNLLFLVTSALAFAFEGKKWTPIVVELLAVTPYMIGPVVLVPIMMSWIRVVSNFAKSPLAARFATIRVHNSPKLRFLVTMYLVLYFGGVWASVVLSAWDDQYYFIGMRASSAINAFHFFLFSTMYFVLGGSVVKILRLSELSSQDAGSTTEQRAKTLKYLKSHTRSMMTTAVAFAAGLLIFFELNE